MKIENKIKSKGLIDSIISLILNSFPVINEESHGVVIYKKNRIVGVNKLVLDFFGVQKLETVINQDICSLIPAQFVEKRMTHDDLIDIVIEKTINIEKRGNSYIIPMMVTRFTHLSSVYNIMIFKELALIDINIRSFEESINTKIVNLNNAIINLNQIIGTKQLIDFSFEFLKSFTGVEIVFYSKFLENNVVVIDQVSTQIKSIKIDQSIQSLVRTQYVFSQSVLQLLSNGNYFSDSISDINYFLRPNDSVILNSIHEIYPANHIFCFGLFNESRLVGLFSLLSVYPIINYLPYLQLFIKQLNNRYSEISFSESAIYEVDVQRFSEKVQMPFSINSDKQVIQFANDAFVQKLRYNSADELEGVSSRKIASRVLFDQFLTNSYLRKKNISAVYPGIFIRKDNSEISMLVFSGPVYSDKKFLGAGALFLELSKSVSSEDGLNCFEYLELLSSEKHEFFICDIHGNIEITNEFSEKKYHVKRGSNISDLFNKNIGNKKYDAQIINEKLLKENTVFSRIFIYESAVYYVIFKFEHKKQNYFAFFPEINNQLINFSSFNQIIFSEIFDKLDLGVLFIDASDEVILSANQIVAMLTGKKINDVVGAPFYSFINIKLEDYQSIIAPGALSKNIASAFSSEYEAELVIEKGEKLPIIITVKKISIFQKEIFVASFKDISKFKYKQSEINSVIKKSVELEYFKNTFFANLSRDLSSPINSIIGLCNMVVEEKSFSKKNQYTESILSHSFKLNRMIEDLIDITQIESRQTKISTKKIIPADFFYQLHNEFNLKIKEFNPNSLLTIELNHNYDINQGVFDFYSDSIRLKQIFELLFNQIIRNNKRGNILFGFKYTVKNYIEFSVLFKSANLVKSSYSKDFNVYLNKSDSQSELSFTLCKSIIELLGGNYRFQVTEKGHDFSFIIPSIKSQKSKHIHIEEFNDNLKGKKVLLLTDDVLVLSFIQSKFSSLNIEVSHYTDGFTVVDTIRKNFFDLILIDMDISGFDGFETLWLIKHKNINVPVITIFGANNPRMREKCLKIGCSDYLTKPLNESILLHKVNRILSFTYKG